MVGRSLEKVEDDPRPALVQVAKQGRRLVGRALQGHSESCLNQRPANKGNRLEHLVFCLGIRVVPGQNRIVVQDQDM